MKPVRSTATYVDISIRYIIHRLIGVGKVRKNSHSLVIASHVFWIYAALLNVLIVPVFATSGFVYVSKDTVVVAADSAKMHTDSKGVTTGFTQQCKILKQGNIFYFPVGAYQLPRIHFDVFEIAKQAIIKAGKIDGIYSRVEPPILAHLPDILRHEKDVSSREYKKWITGTPVISIVFASFENGAPTAAVVEFMIDKNGGIMKPTERTMVSVGEDIQVGALGSRGEISRFFDANPAAALKEFAADPVRASQHLIQLEIDASTAAKRFTVGPPISVLKIGKDFSGLVPGYEGVCKK